MMTREEAKELLTHVLMTYEPRDQYGDWDDPEPYEEAIDMAIEALKAKTDGDLISRQSATSIPVMPKEHRQYQTMNIDDAYERGWYDLQDCIEALPSAEPKTGEWVMLERVENVHDIYGVPTWGVNYMCDNCGFIHTAIQNHFSQYKYCPNCGARMKGMDDEHTV